MRRLKRSFSPAMLLAGLVFLAGGCGKSPMPNDEAKAGGKDKSVSKGDGFASTGDKKDADKTGDGGEHAGWWCDEHGLPENVCDLCSKKFRAAEKAKGNWCEHERVKSSCFKCNPGLREKYAIEYKAKFGKAPPPTEDDEKKDDGKSKDKK